MNDRNIENFMKLATNHKIKDGKESRQDQYYRHVYEKLATGKKVSWNWAAACLCLYWFLYRKMYLASIVWKMGLLVVGIMFGLLTLSTGIDLPLLFGAILVALLPLMLLSGLFGNWFYVRHIHKKIDKGHHLSNRNNIDEITPLLFFAAEKSSRFGDLVEMFFSFASLISLITHVIIDRRKIKKTRVVQDPQ